MNLRQKTFFSLLLLLLISFSVLNSCGNSDKGKNPLYLAVAGPMTGNDAPTGKSFVNAVSLYLDEINSKGGINGRKVLIDIYDDRNNIDQARRVAEKIVKDGRALAVIGHHYSSCSISAGNVYKAAKIPAITPVSTNINVTPENGWYFRTVFNDRLQGRFLANYVHKIFRRKKVSIISEDLTYGAYLARVFEKESEKLGTEIKYKWKFQVNQDDLDSRLKDIVQELSDSKDSGVIFLATHAPEGAKLIKLMRDNGLKHLVLCPDSFASKTFPAYFSKYPREIATPGFYTDGIHVISPLLFDDTSEVIQKFKKNYMEANNNEMPGWRAAFAYDAAMVAVNAIKNIKPKNSSTIKKDRKAIRDFLAKSVSVADAVKGVTGYNYFDRIGDSPKVISMGVFKNSKIISALTQLQEIKNIKDIIDLDKALKDEKVIIVDNRHLYKTNVVYTGIKINKITDINTDNLTCALDFHVWFSYQNDLNIENIEFMNQAEKITLKNPVKQVVMDGIKYKRYRVKGLFHMDTGSGDSIFGRYRLPIRFHHKEINRNNLKFVSDIIGMGPEEDTLGRAKILKPSTGWRILNTVYYQNFVKERTLGNPEVMGSSEEFSQFNAEVVIKKENISLRGIVPPNTSTLLFIVGCFALMIVVLAERKASAGKQILLSILKVIILIVALLSGEIAIVSVLSGKVNVFIYHIISRIFDMLWWIIPAYGLTRFVEFSIWRPVEKKTEQQVPAIIRKFTNFIIYVAAVCCIIAFVYDQKITSLLATSGVIAMIIGLAIQINISNIFSGIALNLERPFRIGDWVKIDDKEGRIIDITWRTTRILKTGGSVECIPNAMASESVIRNYYYPQKEIEIYYTVFIPSKYAPERVKKILLDALLSCDIILQNPEPAVSIKGITELSADYGLSVTLEKFDDRFKARNAVWSSVWEHLNNAGIKTSKQSREIYMIDEEKKPVDTATTSSFINHLTIFNPFSPEERDVLSRKILTSSFAEGETIARSGDNRKSLFIVAEGVVGIYRDDTEISEIARLGAGSFYGELLTGKPRTTDIKAISNCTVFEITKDDLLPFIEKQPDFMDNLSRIVEERMKTRVKPVIKETGKEEKTRTKSIFKIIMESLGVSKKAEA